MNISFPPCIIVPIIVNETRLISEVTHTWWGIWVWPPQPCSVWAQFVSCRLLYKSGTKPQHLFCFFVGHELHCFKVIFGSETMAEQVCWRKDTLKNRNPTFKHLGMTGIRGIKKEWAKLNQAVMESWDCSNLWPSYRSYKQQVGI